eukprot:6212290-Pleurochrysis_carterae.AAC.1
MSVGLSDACCNIATSEEVVPWDTLFDTFSLCAGRIAPGVGRVSLRSNGWGMSKADEDFDSLEEMEWRSGGGKGGESWRRAAGKEEFKSWNLVISGAWTNNGDSAGKVLGVSSLWDEQTIGVRCESCPHVHSFLPSLSSNSMRVTRSGSKTRAVYRVRTSKDRTILKTLDLSSWQPLFLHIIRSRLLVGNGFAIVTMKKETLTKSIGIALEERSPLFKGIRMSFASDSIHH